MRFFASIAAFYGAVDIVEAYNSLQSLHSLGRKYAAPLLPRQERSTRVTDRYLNDKSKKFVVNGTSIPEVDFDIGESYAGQLSIDTDLDNENALFFWFFPSRNPAADDEIVIWLNGGPGCSSMDGLLQENGPFLWQSGTYKPLANPYSWTKLSNMVWIDQPIGTGLSSFSPGAPKKVTNETVLAEQFMGFWKNFVDTFDLKGRKVYLTGESYAGMYVPYIAYYMLLADDKEYFNVSGIQVNDPSIGSSLVMTYIPAVQKMNQYSAIFGLNQSTIDKVNKMNHDFPAIPRVTEACNTYYEIYEAAIYVNPCFNFYHIIDFCPFVWDVLGFPSPSEGPNNYFNRSDVQAALNVRKHIDYSVCGDNELGLDTRKDDSVPSAWLPLPHVIEKTNNVIIGSGLLDFLLMTNGTLATIQNMTWNGYRGFQKKPTAPFFVPYHSGFDRLDLALDAVPATIRITDFAGSGLLGITHHERGLTWCEVNHSGHEIPQYVPGAAFRQLELLLGRISSLTQRGPFTVPTGPYR